MILGRFSKQASETEVFEFSMADALDPPDRVAGAVVTVEPLGLVIVDYAVLVDRVRVWVSEGEAEQTYAVKAVITTTNGRVLENIVMLKVK